ncbi:hypothetical protein BGZ47_004928 [Haplosporangium gracile]|nr:hypothetical protein BGZ47_004928 [Haplosporangium gracile]
MVVLAGRGAHVFLACRSQKQALVVIQAALSEIRSKYSSLTTVPELEFLELDLMDLMDLNKTQQAAKEFLRKDMSLHTLVNNSGLWWCLFELSPDGIESTFAVNHMGHFVLTMILLDRLKASQPSRVVMISSIAHEAFPPRVGIDFETFNDPTKTTNLSRYVRLKLANVLFAKDLARLVANDRVYVNACHPSFIPKFLVPQDDA